MKNLINKLGMVAVIAALGIAGYVVVTHYMKNTDNVKIQKKKEEKIDEKKENHEGNHDQNTDDKCINDSDCVSSSCVDKKCA